MGAHKAILTLPCEVAASPPMPGVGVVGQRSPDAWAEYVPFLAFDVEFRKVVRTTNAIEPNARLRRAVRARGHFPTGQAALKCLYMALMPSRPQRPRPRTLDHAMDGGVERLRHN